MKEYSHVETLVDVHSKPTTLVDSHNGESTFNPSQSFVPKLNPNKHTLGTKMLEQQENEASWRAEWRRLQESGEGCLKPHTKRIQLVETLDYENSIAWNPERNPRAQTILVHT